MAKIFPVILDDALNKKIEEYMLKHNIDTKKDCVQQLLKRGLGIVFVELKMLKSEYV